MTIAQPSLVGRSAHPARPALLTRAVMMSTVTPLASVDTMLGDFAAALRRRGAHVRELLLASDAPNPAMLSMMLRDLARHDGPRFVFDVNGKVDLNGPGIDGEARSFYETLDVRRVTWFVDHPAHFLTELSTLGPKTVVAVVDPLHQDFLRDLGWPATAYMALPHAGPDNLTDVAPSPSRSIDILFVGNVHDPGPPQPWVHAAVRDDRTRSAWIETIVAMQAGAADIYATLASASAGHDLPTAAAILAPQLVALEAYLNNRRRTQLLTVLLTLTRKYKIAVIGDIDPALTRADSLTVLGPRTFTDVVAAMGDSKLVVNAMRFRGGGHERIFYGMAQGAVIVSDPTSLLARAADHGDGIAFLPGDHPGITDRLTSLLEGGALAAMQTRGRDLLRATHSWDCRAAGLLGALGELG